MEILLFLAVLNRTIVDGLSAPLRERWPSVDLWWLFYVAVASGFAIAWFAGVNALTDYIADETLGRVLSSLIVGGGSTMIHDIFSATVKMVKNGNKAKGE